MGTQTSVHPSGRHSFSDRFGASSSDFHRLETTGCPPALFLLRPRDLHSFGAAAPADRPLAVAVAAVAAAAWEDCQFQSCGGTCPIPWETGNEEVVDLFQPSPLCGTMSN